MHRRIRAALASVVAVALLVPATGVSAKPAGAGPEIPTFVEEAAAAGVDHAYDGSWEFFTGGGVAVFDCDDNGLPDLYFAGGTEPAALYRNVGHPGGALAFEVVSGPAAELTEVTGAYPIDIDSDGVADLVVLRRGENVLLRGLGDCTFERANEVWGFDGDDDWTVAFSAKWERHDVLPILAVGDYLTIAGPGETPDCDDSALFRPVGAEGYAEPESLAPGFCALSMLFSDWDRSGRRDLRVTNDRQYYRVGEGQEQLWKVRPDDPLATYSQAEGWAPLSVFGMSIASADVTGDGYPEYYISSMADNHLRTLTDGPEQPTFGDIGRVSGVNVTQPFTGGEKLPSTAWHAEFDDVNNDGLLDLYVAKGNVEAMPDHAANDPSNLLLGRPDGTWQEGAADAGIVHFDRTRGAALTDLNLDGLLDLVEVNRAAPLKLWRNAGSGSGADPAPMGHWLAVELSQDGPNTDAIGAWIEVKAEGGIQTREVTIGGGHVSGQLGPTHFGLGDTDPAGVRVTWPDGEVGEWTPVRADQRIRIERGGLGPVALASAATMTGRAPVPALPEVSETPVLPPIPSVDPASCVRTADRTKSVARLWDEQLLDAIRRDFPAPTVHARNLFHASAAMWDAWAAYDPEAAGVFVDDKIALDYAAYRVLSHRYKDAAGGAESLRRFDELMTALCYPTARTFTKGDSPAALGNRIAKRIIAVGLKDGSRERRGYLSEDYSPVNEPMIVQMPGTSMDDPNRWQPLALEISQPGLPLDPGQPPLLHDPATDQEFKNKAVEVAGFSSLLDPRDGFVQDISPRMLGGSTLGTNDGSGYSVNPVTGQPYERNIVPRADFGRVVAEFWADGPDSETPPGHWNTLANSVTESPGFERRLGGAGEELDPLEWDVKLYLALNGAVHDAAIAAWGAKSYYDYVRPISMIRWMGGLGQSSDSSVPSYHPDGLPLVPGEVEVITEASAAPGARHEHARRRRLDSRRRMGALPTLHVRDAVLRWVRQRPLRVQPGGS